MSLLRRIVTLGFKQNYIERVDSWIVEQLLQEDSPSNVLLCRYLTTVRSRRNVSQLEMKRVIPLIDKHFAQLSTPDSKQRVLLKSVLFQLENACKADFKAERASLIELI